MPSVIIQGSARSHGNTHKIVEALAALIGADVIDLKDFDIHHYDYEHRHSDDDFLPLIRRIAKDYDTIVFATPVYWYSMSGIMKVFFDRISDCLQIEKETGRKFRAKRMAALCCSSDSVAYESFFAPFRLTAAYLGMDYLGDLHTWVDGKELEPKVKNLLADFAKSIR